MPDTPQRRALVVRGGWEGHQPVAATDVFLPGLRAAGYDVAVADDLDVYLDADRLAATDLVVQCWTMGRATAEQVAGLSAAVRAGTGLAGWHGGVVDSFRDAPLYQLMTGGQFVHHHTGGFVDYRVDIRADRAADPVVAGLGAFDVTTEQYYVHVDPAVDVLATTSYVDDPNLPGIGGVWMPVVWKRAWGAGRVFVCTIGHRVEDLRVPEVAAIVERGMAWASR